MVKCPRGTITQDMSDLASYSGGPINEIAFRDHGL